MGEERQLWNEYRATWEAFSRNLDRLQESAESGDRGRVEAALLDVETAKSAHNAARDRLAEHLYDRVAALDAASNGAPPAGNRPGEELIREKARTLWELSGKPQGTAEADWLLAERLVRSATIG